MGNIMNIAQTLLFGYKSRLAMALVQMNVLQFLYQDMLDQSQMSINADQ